MRHNYFQTILSCLGLLLFANCQQKEQSEYIQANKALHLQVDPFIGTGFHGHTFPGATSPFGMVQLSPDTRWEGWDACAGYHYEDNSLYGFAHTHLSGTGATDLSDLLFIPTIQADLFRDSIAEKHLPKQGFSHDDEVAHAGYYRVKLDTGIEVELTTSSFVGAHRYTFPKGSSPALIFDLVQVKEQPMIEASLNYLNEREVNGHQVTNGWIDNQHVYFHALFSEPITQHELYLNAQSQDKTSIAGDSVRGIFHFEPGLKQVEILVGLSFVSKEEARKNLYAGLQSFDELKQANEAAWDDILSVVSVPQGKADELTNFYTALYHAYIAPNRTSDLSGSYRGNDDITRHLPENEVHYSTFSLWDTYRTLHPFFTLTDHPLIRDFVASMLRMYDEQGELPIWPLASGETRTMIGYHATSVIADALLRGVSGIDEERALQAMIHSSNINKKGAQYYTELGFVPSNSGKESVSCTLEYSYDDWAIAMTAKAIGNKEVYDTYIKRAMNYLHLFDGSTKFFRGKDSGGSWVAPFDPYEISRDYTEASAWQYRYAAVQDIYGMAQQHGGREAFSEALDQLFLNEGQQKGELQDITGLIGQYAHGNEPSHHIAYLYTYVGQPWKTQEMTRKIINEMYTATPEGIIGNEDCGQMSAWYIMSALGFYPVTPGSGEYIVTTPLFPEATLRTASGKKLVIRANDPHRNKYIQSISLNGKPIERLFLTYEEIIGGGELLFTLTDKPVKDFSAKEQPYSLTQEPTTAMVYVAEDLALFEGATSATLYSATPGATIYYTTDGSEPTEKSARYSVPLEIRDSQTIKAIAVHPEKAPSPVTTLHATKAKYHPSTSLAAKGIKYSLYHGVFGSTKEITKGELIKQGTTDDITNDLRDRDHSYGLTFHGYIEVEQEGVYEFQLTSDDGSVLYIGDEVVVLNDGSHSFISATGKIALQKGLHPFTLHYWQGDEGQGLRFRYRLRGDEEYRSPNYYQ